MPVTGYTACVLLIAVGALAGCGSGAREVTQTTAPPGRGILTTIPADGPSDPAANLEKLTVASTPALDDVQVTCRGVAHPPSYPFGCKFTAFDREKKGAGVTGTITVYGVYAPTRTYAFELGYGPRKDH
jgi:hypothetical protein